MLDFVFELEKLIASWPEKEGLNPIQIAEASQTSVPQIVEYFSTALNHDIDVHAAIDLKTAKNALAIMRARVQSELMLREKRRQHRQEQAALAYVKTTDKTRTLMAGKNWYSAYRTLSYFINQFHDSLSDSIKTEAYCELMRLGIKANANKQELGIWMQRFIQLALTKPSKESLEDILDFIEAYGDTFMNGSAEKRLLATCMSPALAIAKDFGFTEPFTTVLKDVPISA